MLPRDTSSCLSLEILMTQCPKRAPSSNRSAHSLRYCQTEEVNGGQACSFQQLWSKRDRIYQKERNPSYAKGGQVCLAQWLARSQQRKAELSTAMRAGQQTVPGRKAGTKQAHRARHQTDQLKAEGPKMCRYCLPDTVPVFRRASFNIYFVIPIRNGGVLRMRSFQHCFCLSFISKWTWYNSKRIHVINARRSFSISATIIKSRRRRFSTSRTGLLRNGKRNTLWGQSVSYRKANEKAKGRGPAES